MGEPVSCGTNVMPGLVVTGDSMTGDKTLGDGAWNACIGVRSCTGVTTGAGAAGLTGEGALEDALDKALDPAKVDARA